MINWRHRTDTGARRVPLHLVGDKRGRVGMSGGDPSVTEKVRGRVLELPDAELEAWGGSPLREGNRRVGMSGGDLSVTEKVRGRVLELPDAELEDWDGSPLREDLVMESEID